MDYYEIVKKLVGEINPVGETDTDEKRFENLKRMTELVDKILTDIDHVSYYYKNCPEYSKKRASEFASKFYDQIGIKE